MVVLSGETGAWTVLDALGEASQARYLDSGHLVYVQSRRLWAVRFDPIAHEVQSDPVLVVENVARRGGLVSDFEVSPSGALLYRPSGETPLESRIVIVERDGRASQALSAPIRELFMHPRISPAEDRVAVVTINAGPDLAIWLYDLDRGTRTLLVTDGTSFNPLWTPDGERIAFTYSDGRTVESMYWKRADTSEPADRIIEAGPYPRLPISWSDDGKLLGFYEIHPETHRDVWVVALSEGAEPQPVSTSPHDDVAGHLSPDGRFIAYVSDESGRYEIYVQALAGEKRRWVISADGGIEPFWSVDGSEIFYRSLDGLEMMAVPVHIGDTFSAEAPRLLFEGAYDTELGSVQTNYSVSADGKRFYMVRTTEDASSELRVIFNWTEELNRLLPRED